MKRVLLPAILGLLMTTSFAQTAKHSWIAGGTALFSSKSYSTTVWATGDSAVGLRSTHVNFSPDLGYFISDKFVAGIKLLYAVNTSKLLHTRDPKRSQYTDYGVGPFVRYYFLPQKKKFNFLVDGSYQVGVERGKVIIYVDGQPAFSRLEKYSGHVFSIAGGPVVNLNSSVGFELFFGYTRSKYKSYGSNNKILMGGLGFQVYL
ncbi:MAG: outer membrane beta-barrel protein [Williamsia sp.]|nr:outer membrane beta-barrel protein [Williamsia sp.]